MSDIRDIWAGPEAAGVHHDYRRYWGCTVGRIEARGAV